MRLLKRISISLALVIISLYLSLPFISRLLLTVGLEKNNIKLINIELKLPSYQQVTEQTYNVSSAYIRLEDNTDIHLSDIQLLTNNTVDQPIEIQIGAVKISSKSALITSNKAVDLQTFLPSSFIGSLPPLKLSIASLSSDQLPVQLEQLHALLSKNKITTMAKITPFGTIPANSLYANLLEKNISLTILANNKIKFKLADKTPKTLLTISITLSKKSRLHGTVGIKNAFKQLNISLNQDRNILLDKGNSSLLAEFSLPLQQTLNLANLDDLLINAQFQQQSTLNVQRQLSASILNTSVNAEASLNKGIWQVSLNSNAIPLVSIEGGFKLFKNDKQGKLKFNINKPIILEGIVQVNTFNITQGSIQLSYAEGKNTLADLQLNKLSSKNGTKNSAELIAHFNTNKPMQLFPTKDLSVAAAKADLVGHLAWHNDTVIFNVKPNNKLSIRNIKLNDSKVKSFTISLPTQVIKVDLKETKLPKLSFSIDAEKLSLHDTLLYDVKIDSTIVVDGNAFKLKSSIKAIEADISDTTQHIPAMLVEGDFQYESSLSNASINLFNVCHQPLIKTNWRNSAPTKKSYLNLQWQHDFSDENTLQHWLNTPSLPFNINSGSLSGQAQVEFGPNKTLLKKLKLSLTDAQGSHQLGLFHGIQFKLNSRTLPNKQPQFMVDAFIEEANIGLKISNIKLKSTLSKGPNNWYANIPVATAQVFSGSIGIVEKELQLTDDMKLNVYLKQVNLDDLVATQQIDNLNISGKVSGQIPVHFYAGQLKIIDGNLSNSRAGTIKYRSPLSGSDDINEQLKLTLDVLEDFDYSKLTSKISYNSRILKLDSSIIGTNDSAVGQRPVELNLNTELDLQGMIKALRLQSGLESQIEKLFDLKESSAKNKNYCK